MKHAVTNIPTKLGSCLSASISLSETASFCGLKKFLKNECHNLLLAVFKPWSNRVSGYKSNSFVLEWNSVIWILCRFPRFCQRIKHQALSVASGLGRHLLTDWIHSPLIVSSIFQIFYEITSQIFYLYLDSSYEALFGDHKLDCTKTQHCFTDPQPLTWITWFIQTCQANPGYCMNLN